MGNGNSSARLHQPLQCILYQSFAFGVESGSSLIEYQYRRILQDGTCNADTLTLSATESSATIADIGFVAVFRSGNEVMGIGYLCRMFNLFLRSIFHSKGDIVAERVVEEDGLLVDVANELSQIVNAQIFDVDAVDEHFTLLHVVVARDEIDKCRFSATALSDYGDGLAFRNNEVDILQHVVEILFLLVSKRDMAELYALLKRCDRLRMFRLFDIVFSHQYLIDTLHRSQSLRDVVACLGKFFQGVDDAVEDDQIINKGGTADGCVVQHQYSTKPKDNDNHDRAEELTHGMSQLLTGVHPKNVLTIFGVDTIILVVHLLLSIECLDDAQPTQRFFHHAHGITPQCLCLDGILFQLASDEAHKPAHQRYEDDGEKGELPRNKYQRGEIGNNQDGILEKHVETRHDGIFNLLYVTTHTSDDVTLALF